VSEVIDEKKNRREITLKNSSQIMKIMHSNNNIAITTTV